MKEVTGEAGNVVVVHDASGFHAVSGKCTHFGARLATGALCTASQRLRCPWHGAAFSYATGDIEDFPGADSLFKFNVRVKGEELVMTMPPSMDPKNFRRVRCKAPENKTTSPRVLIIGGGAGGLNCAETLRQEGHCGPVTILTAEDQLPYDRIKLSKTPNAKPESLYLRSSEFLEDMAITVEKSTKVTAVHSDKKEVETSDGRTFPYDRLVIATGGIPRKLKCQGLDEFEKSVFYLRTPEDGNALVSAVSEEAEVLVIGTGFIGIEVAAYLVSKVCKVRVLNRSDQPPLSPVFGPKIGDRVKKMFLDKGVEFVTGSVASLEGDDSSLKSVVLESGVRLTASAVVVGMGVETGLDWLGPQFERGSGGWLRVDGEMRTSVGDVWAVGDVVAFPLGIPSPALPTDPVNVQHWQMALKHGQTAGRSIAGKAVPIRSVPFFWTMFLGKRFNFTGYNKGYASAEIQGSLDELSFIAYYFNEEDVVIGVATGGRDPVAAQVAEALSLGRVITKNDVMGNPSGDWSHLLK